MIPRFPDPGLSHWQTHPEEGGESLAVVSDSKVVWFGSKDFHDVFIEFGLLDLKEKKHELYQDNTDVYQRYFRLKRAQSYDIILTLESIYQL